MRAAAIRAVLLLPFNVLVVVPALLLWWTGFEVHWVGVTLGLGAAGLGLTLMVTTIRLFGRVGHGTLAPWDPTVHLVVEGPYRYVRNPMISGVGFVLLGEVLAAGSWALLAWLVLFALANAIYMPLSEEPGLIERFGDEYREYMRHVPRWLPRRTPWLRGT